jgi:mRNA-degrading endonuclease RelE of RelBE toxin-antitoxin system
VDWTGHDLESLPETSEPGLTTPFDLVLSPSAHRQPSHQLPESIAFAAYEFIDGPLLDNPARVGKRLKPPLADRHSARLGTYRVIHRIDDHEHRVEVVAVVARRGAYR